MKRVINNNKKKLQRESRENFRGLLIEEKFFFGAQGYIYIRENRSFRNPRMPFLEDEQSLEYFRVTNLIGTQ